MVFAYISCQQTPKSYVVFLSVVWVALKRTGFSASEVALKRAGCVARSQRCSKWRPFAFTHALSRICHWSMASSIMPWGIRSQMSLKLCFSSSVSRFSFWVMSGGVETQLTWGGKLCTRLIAKVIRISNGKINCNRLTYVQDIQDYASLIFATQCIYSTW